MPLKIPIASSRKIQIDSFETKFELFFYFATQLFRIKFNSSARFFTRNYICVSIDLSNHTSSNKLDETMYDAVKKIIV
jgi:hypothetical protein